MDYLLDANYLIGLFEKNNSHILKDWQEKQAQSENKFFVSHLIRYEVLRWFKWQDTDRYQKVEQVLARFDLADVNKAVSDLAVKLYRFDVHQAEKSSDGRNFEKRRFDSFHFATAKIHGLTLLSYDEGMQKLEDLYQAMLSDLNKRKIFQPK